MRKFLRLLFIFCFPLILIIISVNYFGDEANLYNNKYTEDLADAIMNGNNVIGVKNFNDRLLQKYIIQHHKTKFDVIVIGSSRSMLIGSENFKNKSIFNHSVTSASLEDLICLTELYESKGQLPKTIVLGIDPWIFNENHKQERWMELYEQYNRFCERQKIKSSTKFIDYLNFKANVYRELLSLSYFQKSYKKLIYSIFISKNTYQISRTLDSPNQIKKTDGSIQYSFAYRKHDYEKREIKEVNGFKNLSFNTYGKKNDFIHLIEFYKSKNIEVVFFLTPLSPRLYEQIKLDERYSFVQNTNEFLRTISESNSIPIIGSFDPFKLNLNSNDFYDDLHLRKESIDKLFRSN